MTPVVAVLGSVLLAAPPAPSGAPAPAAIERGPERSMILAGTILTLTSIAAYGVMAAGLVIGRQAEDRLATLNGADDIQRRRDQLRLGRTGNVLAIAGGASAAALMATGITLIVVGRRRAHASSRVSLLPLRRGAGLYWSLRF